MYRLILLAENVRFLILNAVKYFGIIDCYMPMIPMLFDLI